MFTSEALDMVRSHRRAHEIHARLIEEGRTIADELPRAIACLLAQRLADETRARLLPLEEARRNAEAVYQAALAAQFEAEKHPAKPSGPRTFLLPEVAVCRQAKAELDTIEARLEELRQVITAAESLRGSLTLMHWTPERAAKALGFSTGN